MYTTHGHWFAPAIPGEMGPAVSQAVRCGGPTACVTCMQDVQRAQLALQQVQPSAPTGKPTIRLDAIADWVARYKELKAAEATLTDWIKEARDRILEATRSVQLELPDDAELTVAGRPVLHRQMVTSRRLDTKAVTKDHPELAARYTIVSESERLTIL